MSPQNLPPYRKPVYRPPWYLWLAGIAIWAGLIGLVLWAIFR